MKEKINYLRFDAINEFAGADIAVKSYRKGQMAAEEALELLNNRIRTYEERSLKFRYDDRLDGSDPEGIRKFNEYVSEYNRLVESGDMTIEKAEKITMDFFASMTRK